MDDSSADWLRAHDYRVECLAAGGGFACLVQDDTEHWIGWGATAEEALARVLAQMFPSRAARALLAQSTASASDVASLEDASASAAPAPTARSVEDNEEVATSAPETRAAPIAAPVPPADASSPAIAVTNDNEIRAEVAALADRIETARPELALMSPELQRLHLTAWICRARSLEQARPNDVAMRRTVGAIAGLLADLAKLWWPGSVLALQLQTAPPDVGTSLRLPNHRTVQTWAEAATEAEAHARSVLEQHAARGLDDDGWADAAQLAPAPPSPASVLAEARAEIEAILGSIDAPPDPPCARRWQRISPPAVARARSRRRASSGGSVAACPRPSNGHERSDVSDGPRDNASPGSRPSRSCSTPRTRRLCRGRSCSGAIRSPSIAGAGARRCSARSPRRDPRWAW